MARFDYIPQCHETPGSDNQWEHMAQGILLSYLRKHRAELTIDNADMSDMVYMYCSGFSY